MSAPDRLHIAVLCFASVGGSGVIAAEVGLAMAARGHRVHFLGRAPPSRWPSAPTDQVRFHPVRESADALVQGNTYAIALASALVELARKEPIDLVHAHYAVPHAASAWMARSILQAEGKAVLGAGAGRRAPRVVTTLHGTDVTHADASHKPVTRFAVAQSAAVTTPSHFLRRAAASHLGLLTPIEVIANFVDDAQYAPHASSDRGRDRLRALFHGGESALGDREPVLVHVSNFRPVKRIDDVIATFALVRRARRARLVMIGDGPERNAAQERVAALGLGGDVAFLGRQDHFAPLLAACDVFLLPSESESFGLAALEAMSCGVPVVASDVGGVPEVIEDGVSGLLAPVGDIDAFARHVLSLTNDNARWTAFSAAARARVLERFRTGPAIDAYEAIYRRLMATSTP